MFAKILAATASLALAATPIAASASPKTGAARLSVANAARASTPATGVRKAAGAGNIGVYLVGAALVVGFGFLVVKNAEREDSDSK